MFRSSCDGDGGVITVNSLQRTVACRVGAMMQDYPTIELPLHAADPDNKSALRDVLTDLRHWADENEVDLYAALDRSYTVYLQEKADPDDEWVEATVSMR